MSIISDVTTDHSDLAWLNISQDEIEDIFNNGFNPLLNRSKEELEHPGLRELYLMRFCPEYVYFTAKTLLNVELSPMQCCVQYCLWKHSFPLLCASRGASKAISPDELVKTYKGWTAIKDLKVGDQVYGRDGKLCNVLDKTPIMENLNFYKITLKDGRFIECCEDHQWLAKKAGGSWTVFKTKDLYKAPEDYCIPINEPLETDANHTVEANLFSFGAGLNDIIPEIYLNGSSSQKLSLIKRIFSDASSNTKRFSSDVLATQVVDLCRSLGILVTQDGSRVCVVDGLNCAKEIGILSIEYVGKKPGMCIQVDSPDNTYITKDYIVTHNSYSLALYAILKAALVQGVKIVCVGAAFRQSKILHGYVENIFTNAPVLRSIFKTDRDGTKISTDMIRFRLGQSEIIFIPMGTGEKIRGLRGNIIIADEMNSLNTDIYEIVVNNFAAVSKDPIKSMKRAAKIKYLKANNLPVPEDLKEAGLTNQSIIAGTMGYEFQPMYNYFTKYKEIIDSKGASLKNVFSGDMGGLSYKDFCIMRLPYELIPKGFMDDKTIMRAKATTHTGAYNSEYGCAPVKDSTGFFSRLAIENCVANPEHIHSSVGWPDWCPNPFDVRLKGEKGQTYVMGVDPASDDDNFAIAILEVHPEHQRVVYCWTTKREEVQKIDPNANYYSFCARHIRNLHKVFQFEYIGIDAGGGGIALMEALHDKDTLREGEVPLWPIIEKDKKSDTDVMSGEHVIKMIQFANYKWLSSANHELRKDLESKMLLFPRYNSVILGLAGTKEFGSSDLENAVFDVEELKDELATIVVTRSGSRERWDTPQVKVDTSKVGRMRKDRYSALLIANSLAREINRDMSTKINIDSFGGRAGEISRPSETSPIYVGNPRYVKGISSIPVRGVER